MRFIKAPQITQHGAAARERVRRADTRPAVAAVLAPDGNRRFEVGERAVVLARGGVGLPQRREDLYAMRFDLDREAGRVVGAESGGGFGGRCQRLLKVEDTETQVAESVGDVPEPIAGDR